MKRLPGRFPANCCLAWLALAVPMAALAREKPPVAPRIPVTDTYFGRNVTDDYRWLEDQKSPQSKAWMKGQADYARAMLDSMPGRAKFTADMQRFLDAEPFTLSDITLAGDRIFYRKRMRGAGRETLVVRAAAGGPERTLVDLNALSKPGRHVAMSGFFPSEDGKLVAVVLAEGGEEIGIGHFYETDTGHELPDRIDHVLPWMSFDASGRTLYYMALERLPPGAPTVDKFRRQRTMAHAIGTDGAKDPVVLAQGMTPDVPVADYEGAAAAPQRRSTYAQAIVYPATDPYGNFYIGPVSALATHTGWTKVASLKDKVTDAFIRDESMYLVSFADAPNGKLLRMDARHPDIARAEVVLPPSDTVLTTGGSSLGAGVLAPAADALYLQVLREGYGVALRVPYGPRPKVETIVLPKGMQVDRIVANDALPGALLRLNSWSDPGDFYRYDVSQGTLVATGLITKTDVDLADLVFEEVMVTARDGVRIPLSIIHRRSVGRDGSAPTMLIGYGAYGATDTPQYRRHFNAWLARNGIIAFAHVRGGGEFGEQWHTSGQKATKHNTWEDFLSCAHYLIDQRYTSRAKLGGFSASAGGVLIGRSMTTEPGLFAAVVDGVPLSDAMRGETESNGPTNIPEFGSVATKDGAEALYAMSTYHHIQSGTPYPAVLVTAGANDPRVEPWQGAKTAAALQAATSSGKPVLLRVNYDAGHGADSAAQQNADWTDYFTFLLWGFGDKDFIPSVH